MLSEKSISSCRLEIFIQSQAYLWASSVTLIGCRSTILSNIFFGKCHISYHLIVILVAQLSLVAQLPLLFFTVLFTQLCTFFTDRPWFGNWEYDTLLHQAMHALILKSCKGDFIRAWKAFCYCLLHILDMKTCWPWQTLGCHCMEWQNSHCSMDGSVTLRCLL